MLDPCYDLGECPSLVRVVTKKLTENERKLRMRLHIDKHHSCSGDRLTSLCAAGEAFNIVHIFSTM